MVLGARLSLELALKLLVRSRGMCVGLRSWELVLVLGVGVQSLESDFMLQIQTPTTNLPNHLTPNSSKPTPNSKLLKNQLPET